MKITGTSYTLRGSNLQKASADSPHLQIRFLGAVGDCLAWRGYSMRARATSILARLMHAFATTFRTQWACDITWLEQCLLQCSDVVLELDQAGLTVEIDLSYKEGEWLTFRLTPNTP
jgi:hypothetical protein